jgi:4'-phosphopantetheinyl transferase
VWVVDLGAAQELVDRAILMLTGVERERAARFKVLSARREFVLSRSVLRKLLSRILGAQADYLEFSYNEYGKPRLARDTCSIRFNVSHCGDIAVFAITAGCELGIDIEAVRQVDDLKGVAEHFFCPAERAELNRVPDVPRSSAFLSCWVRKEAYMKALGGGLSIRPDTFHVTMLPSPAALVSVDGDENKATIWTIQDFFTPGYIGAVAFPQTGRLVYVHRQTPAADILEGL